MRPDITLSYDSYLNLLRKLPFSDALRLFLELEGGCATIGQILDALEAAESTFKNNKPKLESEGVITVLGRMVQLTTAREQPENNLTAILGQPDNSPTTARQQPDNSPNSGNNVNDEENTDLTEKDSPIISISIKEEDKETTNTNTKRIGKNSKTNQPKAEPKPASRALASWQELQKQEDFSVPKWLDLSWWTQWLKHLEAKKSDVAAVRLQVHLRKLEKLISQGLDQIEVVEHSIDRGWETFGEKHWHVKESPPQRGQVRASKIDVFGVNTPPTIDVFATEKNQLSRGENDEDND